ncbi:cytosine permease [Nocardia sp. CDC159]|uniref:Cytosine permease n=1 Tax=Nocardia pulmonis TaxID=2951408 RepID=A0A9X2IVN8_9NOCA|nr:MULTISPECIES: cytosine permease [Nocardia]MCM6774082.1 cytosine permease [Nocardia pulmonis]MCM6786969.1 cytosine permease [Nocardia sp. CDC159]
MTAAPVGHDDYALSRVPRSARYPWLSVATQRFGQISGLSQFLLGATLGFGLPFWQAFLAFTLGAVVLEAVSIAVGIIGQREGLSTSVLSRWTGFGQGGSAVVALVIGFSAMGWFGVQSQLAGKSLAKILGGLPVWGWSMLFGLLVTLIVTYGFRWMAWTAYITVPAFLLLAGVSVVVELSRHDLGQLLTDAAPGPQLSLVQAVTLVAGQFMVGAVITPDMTRFNRTPGDVVKQTIVGITLGEWVIGSVGVLLAHALRSKDVATIVTSSTGWVGVIVIVVAALKVNDWNLYVSSLGLANFVKTVFGYRVHRAWVSIVVGVIGSALGAAGILSRYTDFLNLLAVAFPPIPAIMVAEYFVARRWRSQLSDAGTGVPPTSPMWVPATLVIWLAAALFGKFVKFGLPSVNALVAAFVLYLLADRIGLLRGFGVHRTASEETNVARQQRV